MKVYSGINNLPKFNHAIVTSGFFDGVHKGHKKILARLLALSKKNNGETVLITYWPHPKIVLDPQISSMKLLSTFEEKVKLLKKEGIRNLIKIPFTKVFSEMSSKDFIEDILIRKIGTKKLVIGYDHRFGKNREGSFVQLEKRAKQYSFEVEKIPREDIDDIGIGSSKIRNALQEGDIATATRFLGQPYSLSGKVIKGECVGRMMGFPTANLEMIYPYKLIPKKGIYAVTVHHKDNKHDGMLYIGTRPTLNGNKRSIEVNIFDFDRDIYGDDIIINLISLIREDIRFDNLEALKKQMQIDKKASVALLYKNKPI